MEREPVPPAIRWAIWERDDFRCRRCGSRRFLTVDHVVALVNGGTSDEENLQTLCVFCNAQKGTGPDLPPFDPSLTPAALERAALIKQWLDDSRVDLVAAIMAASDNGATVRQIGEAIGLSSSRVHQILHTTVG